jgi:hypothetical protein
VLSAVTAFSFLCSIGSLPVAQAALQTMTYEPCASCPDTKFGLGGRGVHLVVPSLIAPILAFALVGNRLYWRCRMLGRFGLDDIATLLALVSTSGISMTESPTDDVVGVFNRPMCYINSRG